MFLESQNQFRDQMKLPDATASMENAYVPLYKAWLEENKEVLYKWSPEERVQRFSEAVRNHYEKRLNALIESSDAVEDEKNELKAMSKKAALILVSTNEGQTFDSFLKPEDLDTVNPSEYQILSPTLSGATNNLKEVQAQQELLHIVSSFQDQSIWGQQVWLVQDAYIEDGTAHIEVTHYKYGVYQVEVNLDEDPKGQLIYTFINEEGKQAIPETQLPEKYGEAKQNTVLQTLTISESNNHVKEAALAGTFSMLAMQEAMQHASSKDRANESAALAKAQMQEPLAARFQGKNVPNVMAAKAAMAARFARQAKIMSESRKREMERFAKVKQIDTMLKKETKNAKKEAKKSRFSADQKSLAKGVGAGAGIAGAFAGALTGSALFVNHITLFS